MGPPNDAKFDCVRGGLFKAIRSPALRLDTRVIVCFGAGVKFFYFSINTFSSELVETRREKKSHSVVMTKAHAYLRVSGRGQVAEDFTRQLKAIREYAAAHDIKIVNVYREGRERPEGLRGTAGLVGTNDGSSRKRRAHCHL
jgi:hypothetical protein